MRNHRNRDKTQYQTQRRESKNETAAYARRPKQTPNAKKRNNNGRNRRVRGRNKTRNKPRNNAPNSLPEAPETEGELPTRPRGHVSKYYSIGMGLSFRPYVHTWGDGFLLWMLIRWYFMQIWTLALATGNSFINFNSISPLRC